MISELNELKSQITSLETPQSLSGFSDSIAIESICEKIEILLRNIYHDDTSMQVSKTVLRNYFYPSEDIYIRNILEHKRKTWEKGREKILSILDNRIEDLHIKSKFKNNSNVFIDENIIIKFEDLIDPKFDTIKLLQYLREVNRSYKEGDFLSCILLLRAVLNYVPPVFGHSTFSQVVSQSGRSLKEIFSFLEEGLRKIADLHTHRVISTNEYLPTNSEISPYKPQFEILLQEILIKIK